MLGAAPDATAATAAAVGLTPAGALGVVAAALIASATCVGSRGEAMSDENQWVTNKQWVTTSNGKIGGSGRVSPHVIQICLLALRFNQKEGM